MISTNITAESTAVRPRSRRGFSILELVVVIVLVGIMTAISTGKITSMRAQQQVVRGASTIQTQMEKAFALAGRNRAPIHIVWSSSTLTLSVMDRAETISYGKLILSNSSYGFRNGEITATRATTEVFPNGFAQDTLSITITTSRGGNTYTKRVRMSRAGLVKVI